MLLLRKRQFFNVTGTGVPLGTAQTVAKLNDDGSIGISTQGQPFQELSVYASSDVDGSYDPVVKIMLDENGKGTFNANTEEDTTFLPGEVIKHSFITLYQTGDLYGSPVFFWSFDDPNFVAECH